MQRTHQIQKRTPTGDDPRRASDENSRTKVPNVHGDSTAQIDKTPSAPFFFKL